MAIGQQKQEYEKAQKDGRLQKLYSGLQQGLSRQSARSMADIPHATFYDRLREIQDFRTEVEVSEWKWVAFVENKKAKLIDKGYRPAIEKELKSKLPQVYGDKQEIQLHQNPLTDKQETSIQSLLSNVAQTRIDQDQANVIGDEFEEEECEEEL